MLLSLIATGLFLLLLTGCSLYDLKLGRPIARDYDQISASDTLRVITRNHPLTYYLYRGGRRGFDFELIQKFADERGLVLQIVVPPTWGDMIPYLYSGKGDVIASQLTITPQRSKHLTFTHPYMQVRQVAVGTEESPPPMTLDEFNGRSVLVRKKSSYDERLRELKHQGLGVAIEYHDEMKELDDPVQLVARGKHPLTVVDNTIARLEQHFYPGLEVGIPITEPQDIAWAVRPNAPKLLEELNNYLDREYRGEFFNVLKQRYFEDSDRFLRHRYAHIKLFQDGRISPYDEFFREAGETNGFDWRLLAAQAYHETRFSPNKMSWAGAVGLMQVMPRTARAMGVRNYWDPEQNIVAGTRYLKRLYNFYDQAITDDDRIKLSLAAYNAGMTHLNNARRLASALGGNPNRWEDVSNALILLEKPEYHQRDGYDFVRGRTVVRYVEDVLERYEIFKELTREALPEESGELVLASFFH